MIVAGIDPGPKSSAWAVLECTPGDRPRWIAKAYPKNEDLFLPALIAAHRPELVAVETSGDSHVFGKTPQAMRSRARWLALTNRVSGEMAGLLKAIGCSVVEVPAATSRRGIGGKANCSDGIIKRALAMTTDNMPARTNSHTRDAACAAIVGWRMAGFVDHAEDMVCDGDSVGGGLEVE